VVDFISEGFARREFLKNPQFSAILTAATAINRPQMVKSQQHEAIWRPTDAISQLTDVIRRPHMVINQQHEAIFQPTDAIWR
jgi:hypothetical protein